MRESIREVVEDRPQRAVAVAVVVRVKLGRLQIDRGEVDVAANQYLGLGTGIFRCLATPAKPDTAGILKGRENPDREASGGGAAPG